MKVIEIVSKKTRGVNLRLIQVARTSIKYIVISPNTTANFPVFASFFFHYYLDWKITKTRKNICFATLKCCENPKKLRSV